MGGGRTIWHPGFARLLMQRAPHWTMVQPEVQLVDEPLVVDDLIELRAGATRDPADRGETLRGMWSHLVRVGLLEFKSVSRPLRRGDLFRLLAYGWLYLSQRQARVQVAEALSPRLAVDELTLILAVASLTPTLFDELHEAGIALGDSTTGYHRTTGHRLRLLVVDITAAANADDDDLLRWFGRESARTVATSRWVRQYTEQRGKTMEAMEDLDGYRDWVKKLLTTLPLEDRLAGLDPQERLAGLGPQERLAGLGPGEWALALPDEALRALPASVIDALPAGVRDAVRARLRG